MKYPFLVYLTADSALIIQDPPEGPYPGKSQAARRDK